MKAKEELNAIRNDIETLGKKLAELDEDELTLVTGGSNTLTPQNNIGYDAVSLGNHEFEFEINVILRRMEEE